jgi:hypothetical protein
MVTKMSDVSLRLTLVGRTFSLTPLPRHLNAPCTANEECGCRATHRLLSRRTASVELFCDRHALAWSREQDSELPSEATGDA